MRDKKIGAKYSNLDCFSGIEQVEAFYQNERFSKHVHEAYVIALITQGAQRFINAGSSYVAVKDNIVLINADTMHTGEAALKEGWCYRAIYPTPEFIQKIFLDIPKWENCEPFFKQPIIMDEQLRAHFSLIFHYIDLNASKLLLESLIFTFFLRLIGQFGTKALSSENCAKSKRIYWVKDYLQTYSHLNIGLEELSELVGVNKYLLLRQFKAQYGLAPHQYQIQLRIHKAKALLASGMRAMDVAIYCGFYDQSHFTMHFKRAVGTTPTQYRLDYAIK